MPRKLMSGVIYPVALFDTNGNLLFVDEATGESAVVTIPLPHHEIHEGNHYEASYKSADASPIADNSNLDILLVTGGRVAHAIGMTMAGGDAEVFFYEGTTTTGDGTAATTANLNRTSANTSAMEVTHTPTVSGTGTLLLNYFMPGGTGPQAAGGTVTHEVEWILQISTKYLLRITNRAGTAQPLGAVIQWYEP